MTAVQQGVEQVSTDVVDGEGVPPENPDEAYPSGSRLHAHTAEISG